MRLTLALAGVLAGPAAAQCALTELFPDVGTPGDAFGFAVAIDGDRLVVGSPFDDAFGDASGAAFVFERQGGVWLQTARLVGADTATRDEFGHAVAIDGGRIAIGAWHDQDNGVRSGSAYVFDWDGSAWVQAAKLIGSDVLVDDKFAEDLDVQGDVLAVGARGDEEVAVTAGTVYVFRLGAEGWFEETKLFADDGQAYDRLGQTVEIDGDSVAAGAYWADPHGLKSGAVYVFTHDELGWSQEAKLVPADGNGGDSFGLSLALEGDTLAAGAPLNDDLGSNAGSVYVWRRLDGLWSQQALLIPAAAAASDEFGNAVALSGDVLLGGWHFDDDLAPQSGGAAIFAFDGTSWAEGPTLVQPGGENEDQFGESLALDGNGAVVGAIHDDSLAMNAGGATVFGGFRAWTDLGGALAGGAGEPSLAGLGSLCAGQPLTLGFAGGPPSGSTVLLYGLSYLGVPFQAGLIGPSPDVVLPGLTLDAEGSLALAATWPAGVPAELPLWFQCWSADAGAVGGYSASNTIVGTTP